MRVGHGVVQGATSLSPSCSPPPAVKHRGSLRQCCLLMNSLLSRRPVLLPYVVYSLFRDYQFFLPNQAIGPVLRPSVALRYDAKIFAVTTQLFLGNPSTPSLLIPKDQHEIKCALVWGKIYSSVTFTSKCENIKEELQNLSWVARKNKYSLYFYSRKFPNSEFFA